MRLDLNKKYSMHSFVLLFLLFTLPIICVAGVSVYPYNLRQPLIYTVGIVLISYIVVALSKVKVNVVSVLYIMFIGYVALSLIYSYDRSTTMYYLIIYSCALPLLFVDLTDRFCEVLLNIFLVISIIIAISIIISVPIKNCMNTYFWFIVNPNRSSSIATTLANELKTNAYSGFAREKGEAAFIMNVGLAICYAKYFVSGKLSVNQIVYIVLLFAGLLFTSKRTLLLIAVLCFFLLVLLSKSNKKVLNIIAGICVILGALFVILNFIPSLSTTLMRFLDTDNLTTVGGRDTLWHYVYIMISKYWFIGAGFGSFNAFAYDNGMRVYGEKWMYNAHNIYYQSIGELGIVGFLLLFGFFIFGLIKTIQLIRNKNLNNTQNIVVYFSFYIQIMFLVQGVTGNTLYTRQSIFTWVLVIALTLSIYNRTKQMKFHELTGRRFSNIWERKR